jgi:hypothetical protein
MASQVTLEEVFALAMRLPLEDQLKLLAQVSTQVAQMPPRDMIAQAERRQREYEKRMDEFLRLTEEGVECQGEVDAVEDLRRIREERADRL